MRAALDTQDNSHVGHNLWVLERPSGSQPHQPTQTLHNRLARALSRNRGTHDFIRSIPTNYRIPDDR